MYLTDREMESIAAVKRALAKTPGLLISERNALQEVEEIVARWVKEYAERQK